MVIEELKSYLANRIIKNEQSLREAKFAGNIEEIARLEKEIEDSNKALQALEI